MPVNIELQNIPNQNFQLLFEQDSYDITIRTVDVESYVSITRNNEVLISNVKSMSNQNIILSEYKFKEHGNFRFNSTPENDNYPFYADFGISTVFQYVTKEEVENGT